MRLFLVLSGSLLAGLASVSPAQERGDPVRLDDFAVPAANRAELLDQVGATERAQQQPSQQVDRTLARPELTDSADAPPAQVSLPSSTRGPVPQLALPGDSRPTPVSAVSTTRESAPRAATPIGGTDRCDPQLAQRFYAECLRILELRSSEFSAPEPARLSPEQRLISEQRLQEDPGSRPVAVRLQLATSAQPDADLQSNQELAAIYLGENAPTPVTEPAPAEEPADLSKILQTFSLDGAPPLNGN
ncbi:hypothetical protein GCM10011515_05970 [Tsuneonella deserti]|uniref:Uncharacterized protein n=1 Tax=Tsuneonella deserti TaxID=2035528 RepID=A0ABQ1S151_9SPHN|nr:hypothetical protein [Tsuneonella deserti]GGD89102.1 hypothetical protein GCM10011515_05970 [Tsuneonella deserti]